jgi:D-serine deaminase-like pyridoxal phosphate-dependent protein
MPQPPPAAPGARLADVDTPALLIDLDAFERNLERMAGFVRTAAGVRLRPHAKTHKSPIIAAKQIALGAVGVCCQKVSEAEVMVAGGVADVLVSNEVAGSYKLDRLARLARCAKIGVCADDADNVAEIEAAAARAGVTLEVLVEIDVGGGRCGVSPGAPAARLAERVAALPHLRFAGLQAYYGSAQHVREAAARKAHIARAVESVQETLAALKAAGLGAERITGAGTGTYENEAASGVYTELQAGSYIFMDADYARNKRADGGPFDTFEHALFVYATIMSAGPRALRRRCRPQGAPRGQRHGRPLAAAGRPLPSPLRRARPPRRQQLRRAARAGRQAAAGARPLRPHRQPARLVRRHSRARRQRSARRERVAGGGAGRSVLIVFWRCEIHLHRPLRSRHSHPICWPPNTPKGRDLHDPR